MRSNVLLLQGPVGPFFQRFAKDLESNGFNVFKINFNGGDKYCYKGKYAFDFTGCFSEWEEYLENFLNRNNIGRVYLFGDCRSYHKVAKKVAERRSVRLFVFEEGYIRPNFITLEENGVNGNSSVIGKGTEHSGKIVADGTARLFPKYVFQNMVLQAISYYLACAIMSFKFPNYLHHRPLNPLLEGGKWILSFVRKEKYKLSERHLARYFSEDLNNKYFLCPLQVHCDMQISAHSGFTSVEHFIGEVVASFALNADQRHHLIFKHHPMDRGYTDYTTLIKKLTHEYGLNSRVHYVHDLDLPALLRGARGTVVINSTVGMSSLFHGTPVKTLGRAVYDRVELTCQNELNKFWLKPGVVDQKAYNAFRNYLISRNQVNGSFYSKLIGNVTGTALIWSREMSAEHTYMPGRVDSAKPPILHVIAGRDMSPSLASEAPLPPGKLASG